MHFYDKYVKLCKDENVSPSKAALDMGINKGTVSVWKSKKEKGEEVEPSSPIVNKIADHFHVSTDYLLGKTEHPHEYILRVEDYPEIIKPLAKANGGGMVFELEDAPGNLSHKELADILVDSMKHCYVKFNPAEKNPVSDMFALLPESLRYQEMSLFDLIKYTNPSPAIMRQLQESDYNENGELIIPSVAFSNSELFKDIKDSLYDNEETIIPSNELDKHKLAPNIIPVPQMRKIPVLGTIHAGTPILAEENIERYEYADVPEGHEYFFLSVKDESMLNARIFNGDLALIKQQPCAEDGQIVACLINSGEATLKRFYRQGDMVILKPENPVCNPIIVPCKDFENGNAQILGIVTEVKFKM